MNIFIIISLVFGFLLIFGLLIGLLRSWKKSLIRFGILVADLILAIFITPPIVKTIIKKVANGTTLSIFNFNISLTDIIDNFTGSEVIKDLLSAESTTNELFTCLINIVANLVLFIVIFISIWLLSLIIYGIISLIVGHVTKKAKKEAGEEIQGPVFWKRLIGGGIGLVSMCVICFALFVPVFGVINICDEFLSENSEPVASAVSLNNFVSGDLYYTEDSKIGQVETYIETYSKYKKEYDSSFVGAFFNFTGLGKLGSKTFGYLSTASSGELDINFSDEAVAIISTYNAYKEAFVENKFDFSDNVSVDRLINIYDKSTKSTIVSKYIVELLPTMVDKWTKGETFLGISNPVTGTFQPVFNSILKVYSVQNSSRIDNNIRVLFNLLKVANNNELISAYKNADSFDIIAYLSGEYMQPDENGDIPKVTLVKDSIETLSATQEYRNNLPTIFNELFKILYDNIVGGENPIQDISSEQISEIDWNFEANNMQDIVNTLLEVYDAVQNNEELTDKLGTIGRIIDFSRKSKMLSNSLKEFIVGYIKSDKVTIGSNSDKVKEEILDYIDTKWNYEENPDFSFEDTLSTIAEVANVVNSLSGTVSLSDLSVLLEDIADNDSVKEVIVDLLTESDIVSSLVGDDQEAAVVVEFVTEIVSNLDTATLDADIAAAEKLIDVVNVVNDETATIDANAASDIVNTLVASDTIMGLLQTTEGEENSEAYGYFDKLDEQSKSELYKATQELEDENAYKSLLLNLFNTTDTSQGD